MAKEIRSTTQKNRKPSLSPEDAEFSRKLNSARSANLFWHFLTLGLMAGTFGLLLFTRDQYLNRKMYIEILDKPLVAGYYHVNELPDDDLLSFGEEFINLIATYQPSIAEKQFLYAFDMSSGEFKNKFKEQYVKREVKEIKNSKRSQIFYADYEPTLSRPTGADYVVVSLSGEVEKYANERNYNVPASYHVKLKTIPHSKMNEYGISVVGLKIDTGSGY